MVKILEFVFWISLFIIFYTYLGYGILLYLLVKVKEFKNKKEKRGGCLPSPSVTLFITAYNEEDIVGEKMLNTQQLDYPVDKLEIVWVTDGSNDKTNELLEAYGNVTVLYQPERQGKTAAINRGMAFIETPFVVFTDANTMINKDAIKEIVACFENSAVGCVAGEKRIFVREKDQAAAGGEGLYWKYESFLKSLDSKFFTAVGAAGELFAIRKSLFEEMENDTLLDDFILSMRIASKGYKIEYCDKAYALEYGSVDMREEEKRKIRIAAGGIQSIWRLRRLLNPFRYGMLTFQYVSHRVLRWSLTPVLLFLLFPMNILLVLGSSLMIYRILLVLQCLFYIMGLWGYYLSKRSIKNKYLFIPYYFLFMNINVIKGFFYLCRKKGTGIWEKAKRTT
ncbi:glycosyltransferase family 2 protein [Coprobacter tertius]|uniref:Glycosyltransferase family 2 protein n=1 Tax=Coprobacter tertius TaxID=2944915 RepID=A0ABT1MH07_9BACT|nr:glycosyltransferase family 2 protein [Coprobacter tertius]MCP9610943.1 glycosyltransferase family 2 protein [Coprobacter tertius]